MKYRYFSPETLNILSHQKNRQKNQLRQVGSMKKIPTIDLLSQGNFQKIGDYIYQVDKQIGLGYSSKVYKAKRKQQLNKQYAIKIIDLKKYTSSNMEMLENQIKILKKLDHPNVIKCYDIFKNKTHCYIVTQYCSQGDLLAYITRRGKLQQNNASQIMVEVFAGYKYLVQNGIIHRDLKPANILKGDKSWKIADFGFSVEYQNQYKSKYNVGTPLYMPPQALTKNIYSTKSDIFSLGVLYYELIVGSTPWQCKSQKQLIKKMNTLPFKVPQKCKMNPNLKNILKLMCDVDFSERMSKQQFIELDLRQIIDNPQQFNIISVKKIQLTSRQFRYKSIQNLLKVNAGQSKSTQDGDKKCQEKIQQTNNHILISLLHYCRYLYYMIKNGCYFCLQTKSRQKICLILFKHILKIIKQLSDNKKNWLRLENWDNFINSKRYLATYHTLCEYSLRYQREYLQYLKQIEILTIREINKDLQEFGGIDHLSKQFYENLSMYIAPYIRQYNHNLSQVLAEFSYDISLQLRASIYGLKALNKYRALLLMESTYYRNYPHFQKNCQIKVYVDYKLAPNSTVEDYIALRKQIKFI